MKRNIMTIDEERCTGCGECVKGCPEGAIQIIDGKARLVNEAFCDGLGACIGDCPEDAIRVERREAQPYDEKKVVENMVEHGEKTLKAHLIHLKEHRQQDLLQNALDHLEELGVETPLEIEMPRMACGCPSILPETWGEVDPEEEGGRLKSRLRQWPVQLKLVPLEASYFDKSDMVIAADCVPFAYPNFHTDFLTNNSLVIGCPKLDDAQYYVEKLTEIFKRNEVKSIKIVHMEVPCCFSLTNLVKEAVSASGKDIPMEDVTVSIKGDLK